MGFANVPPHPPLELEFETSFDDETCPNCNWDRADAAADYIRACEEGKLLAIETAEGSPFMSMSGTTPMALYWKCPDCDTLFVTEEEMSLGAMS